jgi:hypothetical protein
MNRVTQAAAAPASIAIRDIPSAPLKSSATSGGDTLWRAER